MYRYIQALLFLFYVVSLRAGNDNNEQAIPIVDIGQLLVGGSTKQTTIQEIGDACRDYGFFYIKGHGVPKALLDDLQFLSR